MACKVRYLNSAGIMPREIKGIDALSKAFPSDWLLYVSLNCFPRNQSPMEIDAVVVMDDAILLLEIKDWNGVLTARGDRWFVNGASRKRSAAILVDEKAKKLKTVIQGQSQLAGAFYVDSRVVFTGTANGAKLSAEERSRTLTLTEACAIGDPTKRYQYIQRGRIALMKACHLEAEFDKIFNNTQLFQRLESDWAGYTVTEKDVFVHPKQVWRDHLAERSDEKRLKAMVRTWSFNNLPVGLNSSDMRKLVAMRETNAFAYLQDIGSELIVRQRVLREVATPDEEVSTGHFEVRQIAPGSYPLDQYIVRNADALSVLDRITIVMSMLSIMAELHRVSVTHRDLGPRSIWVGGRSDLALTGFMSCQLPDKTTVMDWLKDLRGYAAFLPEDAVGGLSTGRQRDVYSCAYLAAHVLTGEVPKATDVEAVVAALPAELKTLADWVRRGLAADPTARFASAGELMDAFAAVVEAGPPDGFDPGLLDRFETSEVPYVRWPLTSVVSSIGQKQVYLHDTGSDAVMVKVWMSLTRGRSVQSDCALLRLLMSVDQLIDAPLKGPPKFIARGLSPLGLFVAYERSEGVPLGELKAVPENAGLLLAADLLRIVTALHERSCEHGDISPSNVLINVEARTVCVIDPFDISPVGDGSARTPSMLPANWELLPQVAIDRFAALKAACMLLSVDPGGRANSLLIDLEAELQKPVIESLQFALAKATHAVDSLSAAEVVEFHLRTERPTHGFVQLDKLYVRRHVEQTGVVTFELTTEKAQLVLKGTGGELQTYYFRQTYFATLARESRSSYGDLPIKVTVREGGMGGFEELYAYLSGHERFSAPPLEDNQTRPPTQFEVTWHWKKLLELEEEARVEIAITEVLARKDHALVFAYENLGKDFDFDEEDSIDVFVGHRRIGYVDLSASSLPSAIGIVCERGSISEGDRLRLAERREQTSMERRSRAVRRILDGQSVIGDLVAYFDPHKSVPPKSFDLAIDDAHLAAYGLNAGQEHAFRHLLSAGPVGLLQGPPGTGKTRFIASFVHWLISEGRGQRILIASQSHEAVNNAVESLLRLHKERGETRPSLLRIGSKGITDRIRPFHTLELRESYRVKFDAAAKNRFGQLIRALGVDRAYASELFDLDKQVGTLARRLSTVQEALEEDEGQLAVDRERNRVQRARVQDAFKAAFKHASGQEANETAPLHAYEQLVHALQLKYPNVSPADATSAQRALRLTNDWLASLGSPGRNFEEFLAKTRSVVSATCVGVGQTRIKIESQVFDWVIVDEAARCTPGELAVPIQMAKRVILVGDHLQLLPMMDDQLLSELREVEPDVSVEELARSDFERAFTSTYGQTVGVRLTEQYRMDRAICDLVSECFYEESGIRLVTSDARTPVLQPTAFSAPWLSKPLVWVDASTEHMNSEFRPEGETTVHNRSEVEAVISVLEKLAADKSLVSALADLDDETPIGVICMYAGQKRQIELAWSRRPFDPKFKRLVRIDTVDSYQGKENAIVILSLVRSNPKGSPGHVGIPNRCNVAVSRAQERLIVVGDADMWGRRVAPNSPMRKVFEHMRGNAAQSTILKASEVV
jgi:serine/threonine protein kinase